VTVQRQITSNGVIMVAGQKIPLGRTRAGQVETAAPGWAGASPTGG